MLRRPDTRFRTSRVLAQIVALDRSDDQPGTPERSVVARGLQDRNCPLGGLECDADELGVAQRLRSSQLHFGSQPYALLCASPRRFLEDRLRYLDVPAHAERKPEFAQQLGSRSMPRR
jgi:hypothetical protein